MEERTIVVLTILIICTLYVILRDKNSTYDKSIVSNNSTYVNQNVKAEEMKIVYADTIQPSAIWRYGEKLNLGDTKQSPNGLYKLSIERDKYGFISANVSDPKFDKLHGLAINPMTIVSGGHLDGSGKFIEKSMPEFTLTNTSILSKDKDNMGYESSGMISNIYNGQILSILPNPDFTTYNVYNKDGTFKSIIKAPQGRVTIDNYHPYFKEINTMDHIIFMNDGIKGFDKDDNLLFVDLC